MFDSRFLVIKEERTLKGNRSSKEYRKGTSVVFSSINLNFQEPKNDLNIKGLSVIFMSVAFGLSMYSKSQLNADR